MLIRILSGTAFAAFALAATVPAHAVNYDCSKKGNMNKTVCKTAAKAPTAKAMPAVAKNAPAAPKPAMKPAMASAMKPTTHRAAAAPSGRMVGATLKNGKKVTYNCDKRGNTTKTACKR